jgi:hypothetical protein
MPEEHDTARFRAWALPRATVAMRQKWVNAPPILPYRMTNHLAASVNHRAIVRRVLTI